MTLTLIYDPKVEVASTGYCWIVPGGSTVSAAGYSVASDAGGNSYVTGSFEGAAAFGGTNLVSHGGTDIFVAKYNADGQLLWARQAGGTHADVGLGVAVDSLGACYVTGYFGSPAEFSGVPLKTTGSFDLFLAKYDPNGKLLWVTNTGTSVGVFGRAIAVDSQGNSYLTGGFKYQAQFGNNTFPNNEFSDIFVAKYGPTGQLRWAVQLGGEAEDVGTGIGVDDQGRSYVTGYFAGDGFFGDDILTSVGDTDMFVARLDPDGQLDWVSQAGEAGTTQASALTLDPNGNVLVAGYFDQLAFFGTNLLFSSGFYDLFLTKFDPAGNVLWARNTETSDAIGAAGVATDGSASVYVTGSFYGPAEFNALTLTNGPSAQLFVAKYDTDGNFAGARQAGGASDDFGYAITTVAGGGYVITGTTTGQSVFGSRILDGGSSVDSVIARVGGSGSETPITLDIQWLPSGTIQLQFNRDQCSDYLLQGSEDLQQWTPLSTPDTLEGLVTYTEVLGTGNAHRFFRLVSPQP